MARVLSSLVLSYPRGMVLVSCQSLRISRLSIKSGRVECSQRMRYISSMSNRGRFLKPSLREQLQVLLQRDPEASCLTSLDLEAHNNWKLIEVKQYREDSQWLMYSFLPRKSDHFLHRTNLTILRIELQAWKKIQLASQYYLKLMMMV